MPLNGFEIVATDVEIIESAPDYCVVRYLSREKEIFLHLKRDCATKTHGLLGVALSEERVEAEIIPLQGGLGI